MPPAASRLPTPGEDAVGWVREHLRDLVAADEVVPSERFRGGQTAADGALSAFDVAGYASRRSEVWPTDRRGASALSPYVRHGLLPLPRLWREVAGPARDVDRFRDELLWQEYARHLYARLGPRIHAPLRFAPPAGAGAGWTGEPLPRAMACLDLVRAELDRDGWLVNQVRLWVASQWAVRAGATWQDGERALYRQLLDGSTAANGLGWQWAVGTATGKVYGFSRWQVETRAPGLCATCALRDRCPVQDWPAATAGRRLEPHPLLRSDPDPDATAGPAEPPEASSRAEAVWLTAESLGDADPALAATAGRDLPAVFVFDVPLLSRLRLAGRRLVFLTECLADLARRRPVEVHRGDPVAVLAGRPLAATYAPVPGWRRRGAVLDLVEVHPWPWLTRPRAGPLSSYTAWARRADPRGAGPGAVRSRPRRPPPSRSSPARASSTSRRGARRG